MKYIPEATWETLVISMIAMIYDCSIFSQAITKGNIGFSIIFLVIFFETLFINLFINFKDMGKFRKLSWRIFVASIIILSSSYLLARLPCQDDHSGWCTLGAAGMFLEGAFVALFLMIIASIINVISFVKNTSKKFILFFDFIIINTPIITSIVLIIN